MEITIKLPEEFESIVEELVSKILDARGYKPTAKTDGVYPFTKEQIEFESSGGIINRVCAVARLSFETLIKKSREVEILIPRQILHLILYKHTNLSYTEIGVMVGSKSHGTVMNSCKTISNLIETDKAFNLKYKELIYLYGLKDEN